MTRVLTDFLFPTAATRCLVYVNGCAFLSVMAVGDLLLVVCAVYSDDGLSGESNGSLCVGSHRSGVCKEFALWRTIVHKERFRRKHHPM